MTRDDDVREMIDRAVDAIEYYDSNPTTWLTWILYLLQNLEQKSFDVNPSHEQRFEDMIVMLKDTCQNRLRNGSW